jgi:hypothetical protein
MQQHPDIGRVIEIPRQDGFVERRGRGKQQRLDEAQLLRPLAHAWVLSPAEAGLRR